MSALTNPRLPKGSTILVTGVTGYIGSWVAYEALVLGYKVKGAVRNPSKAAWLETFFGEKFPGQYQNVEVTAVSDRAQLKAAVEGVAGIAHVSINANLPNKPEPYITEAIDEVLGVLEAAQESGTVKAVVLTSSSMASAEWGHEGPIGKDSYNEAYIKLAYDDSFTDPGFKPFTVYAAAKAKAEQAAWKWFADNNPPFSLNQVLPSCNYGPAVSPKDQGGIPSTGGWPKQLFDGQTSFIVNVPAQFYIDVRDNAKLHIAGLIDPKTNGERLFGFAEPQNWNKVLGLFRKIWPDRKFVDDLEGQKVDTSTPAVGPALKALKDVYGMEGWTSLETTLREAGYDA